MAHKARRIRLLEEVRKQIETRTDTSGPIGDLKAAQEVLTYLSWLAWHCGRFAAVPSFLQAARSDIVAIVYAGAIGMERSAYLHARSLLENLVRHCYYDSRPAVFTARHLEPEDGVHDRWAEQFKEIQRLPHFQPTRGTLDVSSPQGEEAVLGGSALFAGLNALYAKSSRFVHGSTVRYRSDYEGIGSITLAEEHTKDLGDFLQDVGEIGWLLLSMAHLGPYLLILQPIRRQMLGKMRVKARERFLICMKQVSLPWATLQMSAALRVLNERKRAPMSSSAGLLLEEDGIMLVVKPTI